MTNGSNPPDGATGRATVASAALTRQPSHLASCLPHRCLRASQRNGHLPWHEHPDGLVAVRSVTGNASRPLNPQALIVIAS